jgi:predicted nuclease of predicted toxin-antitoxin system
VIAFLVDQNFNDHVVAGMSRRNVSIEFTYVRDVGLAAALDPVVLEWAARHDLILLTHDRKTVPSFAYRPGPQYTSGSISSLRTVIVHGFSVPDIDPGVVPFLTGAARQLMAESNPV